MRYDPRVDGRSTAQLYSTKHQIVTRACILTTIAVSDMSSSYDDCRLHEDFFVPYSGPLTLPNSLMTNDCPTADYRVVVAVGLVGSMIPV